MTSDLDYPSIHHLSSLLGIWRHTIHLPKSHTFLSASFPSTDRQFTYLVADNSFSTRLRRQRMADDLKRELPPKPRSQISNLGAPRWIIDSEVGSVGLDIEFSTPR
jgi:hypothetical protein